MKKVEEKILPKNMEYSKVIGLRLEAIEKLDKVRPQNIGEASRISGVTPAAISILLVHLKKMNLLGKN